jgi:phospholipid/cholesterol/gamma-HCH transport system substrate-binding protein
MRKIILVAMIVFGLAVVLLTLAKHSQRQLQIRTYFTDARGLRAGAPVRVAGVDVGRVADVHVRPELMERAAEVVLLLETPYELKIPDDSVVSLRRDGLLGEMYAEVDVRHASGPTVGNQGVLKAREEEARPQSKGSR